MSFRLRLTLQTVFVAGVVVAGFGVGSWWFARAQQARNHDLWIEQEARRLWVQLTPLYDEADFVEAVKTVFSPDETPVAVTVMWHWDGNPSVSISGPQIGETHRDLLLQQLPEGPAVVTESMGRERQPRQARARSPGVGRVGGQRRPVMPDVRTPDFFTVETGGDDWRFGAFSNPHYTLFVGFSMSELRTETRRTALWFVGAGIAALCITGIGAWWASGRAIRPLDRIVSISNRMSAGGLDERIPSADGDDREFVQLINSLNRMTARLSDSFEQAARFTADASHELKTPLAVMQSTLNEIIREEALDEATHERIGVVLHQAARLKHITHSLLLLSQADAGELPVQQECYDLSQDLEGLVEDAESLCESAGLTLEKAIDAAVIVEADRALMHQVFQNLVSNAVKHNRSNGCVSVRLSRVGDQVRFEITNTCSGTLTEGDPRLFERFYRGESSRRGDGFGLGLNIARELARANGASLELTPTQEGVTRFVVSLLAVQKSVSE